MAKKKVPINEKVKTRKDEIRIKTDDPKRMLNKYICARVLKTWTEDFVDKDTGKIVSVERNEVLFEKGTYEKRKNILCIEKAAPMPVRSFVPKEYSLAYNEPE